MKKLLSVLLSVLILASSSFSAFATSTEDVAKTVLDDFGITETVDEYHRVVRTFERDEVSNTARTRSGDIDYSETKAILLALGMEQDFIDKLSTDTLEIYRTSPQLVGTTSYTKSDADYNMEYVEEEVALEESAIIKEAQEEKIEQLAREERVIQTRTQDTYEDSYMRVFYLVTYQGSGNYYYSTDARWLTMPFFRGKDSIGSCTQNGTVTDSTRSGWYEYDITYITNGVVTYDYDNTSISSSDYKNAVNGNWYGSAGIINLPNDISTDYMITMYDNYKAHYEYNGHVNYPNLASWFNTVGSYVHSTFAIVFSPSVSIDTSGNVSASIGIAVAGVKDTRSVELEIYYQP